MSIRSETPVTSLYVHVPFCAQKCEDCAFYSEPSRGETVQRYVDALVREMELVAADLKPKTVFFGGGTPSLLNLKQWEKVLGAMERLELLGAGEWTIECNPATVSFDKARLWRSYGVNRVSMGVQSFDESLLDRLGRIHSREMVFKSYELLRQAGFDNVNLDLMFAIPGQTIAIWKHTLEEALALGSEHLSCYEVIYEEDTPLYAQLQAGKFSVSEDLACAMYDELLDRVSARGFEQYEIANFARVGPRQQPRSSRCESAHSSPPIEQSRFTSAVTIQGFNARNLVSGKSLHSVQAQGEYDFAVDIPERACRHNVNYWRGGSFYGLGPSAAGYVRGVRTKNWSNTILYCERLEQRKRAIESSEELSLLRRAGEVAAFGLRMNNGWPLAEFQGLTGLDLRREWASEIQQLIGQNWARLDASRFYLTREGLRFADAAAELFLR